MPPGALTDLRHPEVTLRLLSRQFGHTAGNGFSHPGYLTHPRPATGYYVYRAPLTTYQTDQQGNRRYYDSERPILDAYPGIDGLFLSVAHAGHGVMDSPASGEIVASYVLGQPLSEPIFAQFQLNVSFGEHDAGGL